MPSFFFPTPGDWTAQESPAPGNLPRKAKKMLMSGGSTGMRGRRSWNSLMHYTKTFTSLVSRGSDKRSPKLLGQDKPSLELAVG